MENQSVSHGPSGGEPIHHLLSFFQEVCFLLIEMSADACKCLCSVVILLQMADTILHELLVHSGFLSLGLCGLPH